MYKCFFEPLILTTKYTGLVCKRFAGHSKWQNIRHIKGQKDSQRSLLFNKLGQQMKIAIQEGGSSEPSKNYKLEQIISQARRMNMPSASIDNVIKTTQRDKMKLQNYLLEIRGPGNCTILVQLCSPNVIRTKQTIANIMKKHMCQYCKDGLHNFQHKGVILAAVPEKLATADDTAVLEQATSDAIECDMEDVTLVEEESESARKLRFISDAISFYKAQKKLETFNYQITDANLEYIAQNTVTLSEAHLDMCSGFLDKLEAMEDVIKIYDNIE